jgi:hypothetical protein
LHISTRLILTVLAAVVGVVCGALIGAFGLFYLCEFIDWMRDAGPGNKIGGGAWILLIFTVPGGGLILGIVFGTVTWHRLARKETKVEHQGAVEQSANSTDEFLSEDAGRDYRFDDD